jgi:hypothetical protein
MQQNKNNAAPRIVATVANAPELCKGNCDQRSALLSTAARRGGATLPFKIAPALTGRP